MLESETGSEGADSSRPIEGITVEKDKAMSGYLKAYSPSSPINGSYSASNAAPLPEDYLDPETIQRHGEMVVEGKRLEAERRRARYLERRRRGVKEASEKVLSQT